MKENEKQNNKPNLTPVSDEQQIDKPEVKEVKNETKNKPTKPVKGVVVNCDLLNIRQTPENVPDNITGTVTKDTEIIIDESKSTDEYYKVKVEKTNAVGYCMKSFIKVI